MELWDFQKKAVDFIQEKQKAYLALDLGMGKTITSLASVAGKGNILLVAEKNEIVNSQNFKKEVNAFFPNLEYFNLREEEPSGQWVGGINPDGIEKLPNKLTDDVTALIVDEATLAKNTNTKRFKKVHKIAKQVDHLVLLSGTPIMNGAGELYAPLLLMDHWLVAGKKAVGKKAFEKVFAGGFYKQIRSKKGYSDEYVRKNFWKFYGWWAKGANNLRELRYLLSDSFFIMSKGETDVFKKKTRRLERVEMTLPWLAEYTQAWKNYLVDAKKRKVDMDNVLELRRLIENGQCYQVNSRWKAKQVAKDISDGKYGDKRIVVFTLFIESDQILQEELERLGVTYRTFEELNEWKEGTEQVLCGRVKSHNKGGNVPEASICIMSDMDFVPSNNLQAENRIDRPEQTRDMEIIYYMTEGADVVDKHVQSINRDKIRKIEEFMRPLTDEELKEMPARLGALRAKFPKEAELLGI